MDTRGPPSPDANHNQHPNGTDQSTGIRQKPKPVHRGRRFRTVETCSELRGDEPYSTQRYCSIIQPCLIESAVGVERAYELATDESVATISLGEVDLRTELGATVTGLDWARNVRDLDLSIAEAALAADTLARLAEADTGAIVLEGGEFVDPAIVRSASQTVALVERYGTGPA